MSNVAPQPFDPYHKWLGISPAEQPPTWYRLLGIPLFESDPDVIDAAADQRMTHLRKYQTGVNSALSQQLLNEVASARIGLLSPEKKAVYDAELRAKVAAASRPVGLKPVASGSGEPSAKDRGKAEPSSIGGKSPPKLPVAVAMDSPVPATAAPAPVPAANVPPVVAPPVNPRADAGYAAFTPVPVARVAQPKPQGMANLIVGISVAAGIALLAFVWWRIQGSGTGSPIAPAGTESAASGPEPHATVVPASPGPLPDHKDAKVAVRPIPPSLLEPREGAVLCDKGRRENQGKGWDFRWSPVVQAEKYHLCVTGPSDKDPLINNSELTDPSYHCNGIVSPPGAERRGWRWKVRAMVASQTWTDWSPERKFDVQPEPPPRVAGPVGSFTRPDVAPKPVKPPKETTPAAPVEPETPIAETPARAAVPDDAALTKASKAVSDIYAAEHDAARTAAQKVTLAKKLLEQAAATRKDPAAYYVLLKSARDLANQAGDATLAFQAIDEMSAAFEVDGMAMKVDAVNRVVKGTQTPAQLKALVDQILSLMDALVAEDRFDDALALAPVALERARRTHDSALSKQVNQHRKDVEAIGKAFAKIQPLAERLSTQPDDLQANYRVGRYRAAIKSDWKKALPMLAKGSDASWKKLAQQELAPPSTPVEQLTLADGWWDAAQSAEDAERNGLLVHAGSWYRKAQPDVAPGLDKARVDKRLAEIDQLDQPSRVPEARRPADFKVGKPVDVLKRVDVARDQVTGQWKRANEAIAGTGDRPYTRLMLPVAIEGSYDLQVAYALVNRSDRVIVIIPIGSQGCAIYAANASVGIYAKPTEVRAGAFRTVTSQSFRPDNLPRHILGVSIRLDGDTVKLGVAVDGVPELTWICPKDSLDIPTICALPSPGHPGLGSQETDTAIFGGVTLRLVSGKASWAEPAAKKPADMPGDLPGDRPVDSKKLPSAPSDQRKPREPPKRIPGVDAPSGPDDSPLPLSEPETR
jgi:hypothetical protein